MASTTKSTLERMNVTLDDHGVVGLMSGGQRQAVAVSRAAAFASRVVILDEPTAALGVRESRRVLDLILRLRDEQKAVLIVSHALDHVIEVADRAVIMRRGRKVGEVIPSAGDALGDRLADRGRWCVGTAPPSRRGAASRAAPLPLLQSEEAPSRTDNASRGQKAAARTKGRTCTRNGWLQ